MRCGPCNQRPAPPADGTLSELARIQLRPRPREGEAIPGAKYFELDGRGATEVVLRIVPKVLRACLEDAGIPAQKLDRLIVHQANVRLVEALAEELGLCEWQVPMTGRSTGNTGAASIPVGLALSHQGKPLSRGDTVALATIGAGASVATAVLRWY